MLLCLSACCGKHTTVSPFHALGMEEKRTKVCDGLCRTVDSEQLLLFVEHLKALIAGALYVSIGPTVI